jgi:glycosyltransferase involved in cell wall biosynthesis
LKIVLNLIAANTGGQVTRARSFLKRVTEISPDAELIVFKINGSMPELISSDNITVIEVRLQVGGRLFAMRRMLWENLQMLFLLSKIKADVYLSFSHYLPIIKLPIPSVVAVSNLAPFSIEALQSERFWGRIRLLILRRTILFSAKRADAVIALSLTCKKILINLDIMAVKIKVVPNGVDPVQKKGSLKENTITDDGPYILTVSHFYRYKNFEQLINAYSTLGPEIRNQYRLKIVGKFYDKEYVKELELLAKSLGILDRVDFIPGLYGDELHEIYLSATLFVFTSLVENSPNILLEAMSYGIPIISIKNDPMPEFGGNAAVYFNSQDNLDLALKIRNVISDGSLLVEMGLNATKQSNLFSWDKFTNDVITLCSSVSQSDRDCT